MADPTLDEMMSDLASADAAGDTELAQHIAGRIKSSARPSLGMGDVQAAPSAKTEYPDTSIVPPWPPYSESDKIEVARRMRAKGITKPYDPKFTLAVAGAALAPELLGPVLGGATSGGLASGATSDWDPAQTATGTVAGGAIGAALPLAMKAVTPAVRWLKDAAITQGRKALSGIGTSLSARAPIAEAAVQQALENGAIRPFSGVKGIAERLGNLAETQGTRYGQILQELEARGVHGPQAEALARQFADKATEAAQTSLNSPRPGMLLSTAQELEGKALPISGKGRLGLMQSEEMKRTLQAEAAKEYDKINRNFTVTGQTKKEIAGTVKDAIEQAVQEQASLAPEQAAAFEPAKRELSNTYEALRAAEEGAARAARRKPISLSSTIIGSALLGGGHEALALPAALAHGLMDSRLASTLATGANAGAKILGPLSSREAGLAIGPTAGKLSQSSQVEALIAALRRGRLGLTPAVAGDEENP